MHRDDWNAVYLNQDRILQALKSLENEIFLAGIQHRADAKKYA